MKVGFGKNDKESRDNDPTTLDSGERRKGEKINIPKSVDDRLLYFVLLIFGISTGENMPSDLIKTVGNSQYGYYSKTMMDIFNLGVKWQYGLAKANEIIADKVQSPEFKLLLMKFAQVLRLGEDLRIFFKNEMDAILNAYVSTYDRTMKSMELLMGMYSTMMSTSSFMVASMMILMMLSGNKDSSNTIIWTAVAILAGLASFNFIMYKIFPRDQLMNKENKEADKFRRIVYVSLGASISVGLIISLLHLLPLTLAISIAGVPLLYAGLAARKMDDRIRKLDDYYPSFARHLGDVYNTVGSLGQSLRSVLRSDFGSLSKQIEAMYNRVMNRTTIEDSFELLSKDTGSALIKSGNSVLSNSMVKGANMLEVGSTLSYVASRLLEIRKRRQQFAKALEFNIIIMHVMTLAVLSLINRLIDFLNHFSALQSNPTQGAQGLVFISSIDPFIMTILLPSLALALTGINSIAVKISQGGLYYTIWLTIAILLIVSGLTLFGVDQFLSQMLNNLDVDKVAQSAIPSG